MTALIAVTYPSFDSARSTADHLRASQTVAGITLLDLVIAERCDNEKIKLHQSEHPSAQGALGGGLLGLLVGVIFAAPAFGFLGGAAIGAASGLLADHGIPDDWMQNLADQVAHGRATLFVLLADEPTDKAMELFGQDGAVLYTSLDYEDEERLRRSMRATLGA